MGLNLRHDLESRLGSWPVIMWRSNLLLLVEDRLVKVVKLGWWLPLLIICFLDLVIS